MKYSLWVFALVVICYTVFGVGARVDDIKRLAPAEIADRNWKILRYEGYEYGAWAKHGGKVWYHVKDNNHSNTYYRVHITKWGEELHFYYGKPESLQRLNLDNG